MTGPGTPPRRRPAEVLEMLADQLREDKTGGSFYICTDGVLGVLSLPAVSVWTNGRVLWWRVANGETTWPAADAPGAARQLAAAHGHGSSAAPTAENHP